MANAMGAICLIALLVALSSQLTSASKQLVAPLPHAHLQTNLILQREM
jgi:hypothetical protein